MMYSLAFVVLAAAIPAFVTAAPTTSCTRSYTVVAGDTCDAISAANGVSTFQLMQTNSGTVSPDCTSLQIGQVLCLGVTGSDCTDTVTVVEGDICQSVADASGIDLSTLFANNPNIDSACSNIYPGEVLCVAQQVMVTGGGNGSPASPAPAPPASDPSTQTDPSPDTPANVAPDAPSATPDSTNPTPDSTNPTPASTDASPAGPTSTDNPDEDLPDCEDDEDDGQQ